MSFVTVFIVSGIISFLHHATVTAWLKAFLIAWPIVFLSIITVAPKISQLVDKWHYGKNEGKVPVEIVVFYASVVGEALAVSKQ